MSAWLSSPSRLQPGEHPVHHAEQQHRQRLVELARAQLRPRRDDRVGEGGDDLALAVEDAAALGRRQEADVLGQDAVLGLRAGVDLEEGRRSGGAGAASGACVSAPTSATSASSRATCAAAISSQQLVLVAEVVIERGLGDAAGLGDLVHRGRGVAVPREQLGGAGEDRLALQVVASGSSARHAGPASLVERQDDALGQRMRLAGQDEAGGDLVLLEREVALHPHLALEQLGAAGAADARLARERHLEPGGGGGVEDVALLGVEVDLAC